MKQSSKIQAPDFAAAKRNSESIFSVSVRIAGALDKNRLNMQKLQDAARRVRIEQSGEVLGLMSVDCLNSDKQGIRISALKGAGIETMQQLAGLSKYQINNIRGIGDETADKVFDLTQKIVREVAEGVGIRLSVDKKTPAATQLLQELYQAVERQEYVKELTALHEGFHASIEKAAAEVTPAKSRLKWLFASADKKSAAADAADYFDALRCGDYLDLAEAALKGFSKVRITMPDKCWEDFEKRAPQYYAMLESAGVRLKDGSEEAFSGLPAQLVEEVNSYPLKVEKLKATLRSYQTFGTKYILYSKNSLLGDEMGLGKTMQAIAAMVSLAADGSTHFMVVCPASVLVNWAREITQFCAIEAVPIRCGDENALNHWMENGGVAVTTYEAISRFTLPDAFSFSMLVVDEAHYVKNPEAKRTKALNKLKESAERTLFMTGTPLENKVEEMCFLVRCLRPDVAEELERMKHLSSAPQFREKLAPVYLRRTREAVLTELPELTEKEEWCELTPVEERTYYDAVCAGNFMAMRQVSWLDRFSDSSKALRLRELCELAADEGRKVIVFSFFRNTIAKVCTMLGDRCLEPITGSVSPQRRQEIIDEFTAAESGAVLVCQVQAGGTGLNIQAASVIIFCEPQIKPSIENQAISRAYRMGQVRNVLVYRLLCSDTVDERVTELREQKQVVFDNFADESVTGTEYMKEESESKLIKDIIEKERKRLNIAQQENV